MHYHTAYTVGVKTKWESRPQSSACMVSTAPPLALPSVVSLAFLCFYSMAHKSSEAQNTTGRVILIAYTTLAYFFCLLISFFFFLGQESRTALNHRLLWIKSGGTISSRRCWNAGWRHRLAAVASKHRDGCILESLCVRGLAVGVSWERWWAGGRVAGWRPCDSVGSGSDSLDSAASC